ncbi:MULTISPECIES: hypothetical protein [unclassified Lentimicrobium]|uniref:hypothetical protein n=1 Tax=unclassified Lentimicrobium TaxID=2677434 RepID=UPI0015549726|nr:MULTISPECIES: hypothetical protein [unclassified Lentimicrobium]NPD44430.1 hypothetical protein [Lentimicrobium sp. S6]NPD84304.1 hypothetical protein [Lentimicrobium sp. L6]
MKKLILSLALAAFIGGSSLAIAGTTNSTDQNANMVEMIQDGKKKATSTTKDAKKEGCDKKAKSDCKSNDVLKKKSCCSDGKATKEKAAKPEKK